MKIKALVIVFATVFFAWAVWAGVLNIRFEKKGDENGQMVIKIDKNAQGSVVLSGAFHGIGKITEPLFENSGGRELMQRCKKEPVLFGGLFIFAGVSLCAVGFIVYMIRTDSRFT